MKMFKNKHDKYLCYKAMLKQNMYKPYLIFRGVTLNKPFLGIK